MSHLGDMLVLDNN